VKCLQKKAKFDLFGFEQGQLATLIAKGAINYEEYQYIFNAENTRLQRKPTSIHGSSGSHICAEFGRSFRAAIALFSHTIGHTMQVLTLRTPN